MTGQFAVYLAALAALGVTADSPEALDEEAERLAREERQT